MMQQNIGATEAAAFAAWRMLRAQELAGPDSWLGLTGLYWLEPGRNSVGTDPDSVVRLSRGVPWLGDLFVADGTAVWHPREGGALELASDAQGEPDIVEHDGIAFFIIAREGRLAARVRDRRWAEGHSPVAIPCYPYAPEWVVEAVWLPLDPPLQMEVPNVSGDLKNVEVRWQARFAIGGDEFSLLPMANDDDGVFFVVRDRTSGRETYGAGRFLKVPPPRDGRIVLDFNRAYNPPCAFTPFATCPLPPAENWLPFAVPAGEMTPAK